MEPGAVLAVECTDPLAGLDLANLVRERGDALLGVTKHADFTEFRIRKRLG